MRTPGTSYPLDVTKAFNWLGGVAPGDKGSSLITGHAYARGSSEWNLLPRATQGMIVKLTTPTGRVLTFKMTSVNKRASVHLSERTTAMLRSHTGKPRIAINTCNAETYDFDDSEYDDGVVIIAVRVPN